MLIYNALYQISGRKEWAKLKIPEGTLVSELKHFIGAESIYKCLANERQEELDNSYRFRVTGFVVEFTFDEELEEGELEKRISNYSEMEQALIDHHGKSNYVKFVRSERRIKYDLLE